MSQVQPIIEAAEQAATGIIAEAEAKAAKYVEESRQSTERLAAERAQDMWALTDQLIARAEAVKRQSDELLKALNQTRRGAEAALQAGAEAPPAALATPSPPPAAQKAPSPQPPQLIPRGPAAPPPLVDPRPPQAQTPPPQPAQAPSPRPSPGPGRSSVPSEGARLLATQMAVAGSTRDEISARLRNEFGIEDTESMLDSILGPR